MLRYGFFLFGSNLIFLAHVNTFVLLTANFGDLKRIAQKFVPEAVADNIADFITKASESLTGTNISEEDTENYNFTTIFKKKSSRDKESESEDSKDKEIEDAQSISDEVTTKSSIVSIDSIQTTSTESFHNKKRLGSDKKRKQKINADKVDVNRIEVESKTVYQRQKTNDNNVYVKKPEKDDSKKNYQGQKTNDHVNSEKVGSKNRHQQKKTNVKVNINQAKVKSKKVYQRKKNDKVSVNSEQVESQKGYQHKKTTTPQNILEIKIEYDESEQSDERNNEDSKSFTLDVFSDENKSQEKSNVVDSLNRYSDEDFQNNIVVKATPNSKYSEFKSNEYIESNGKHSNQDSLNQDRGKMKSEYSKRVESNESKDESKSKNSKRLESNESNDKSISINSNESYQDNMYKADISDTLTTRVERNEFDQYVNLNYPKSELVATSGPLALTMVVDTRIN